MTTATFVSMMTWHRCVADEAGVRRRIEREEILLWGLGMHSINFVSDEPGESAAVMLSTCDDHAAAAKIAEVILGDALIRVDTMRLDEPRGIPAWLATQVDGPPRSRAARPRAPHEALAA